MPVVFVNGYVDGHRGPLLLHRRPSRDDASRSATSPSSATRGSAWPSARAATSRRSASARASSAPSSTPSGCRPRTRRGAGSPRGCSRSRAARPRPAALVERGATAIVYGSDLMALGAIRAARESGLYRTRRRLGGRVRRLAPDPVPRPAADHGAAAGADGRRGRGLAARRRDRRHPLPVHEYLYKPELVLRASTGPAPADARPIDSGAEQGADARRSPPSRRRRRPTLRTTAGRVGRATEPGAGPAGGREGDDDRDDRHPDP